MINKTRRILSLINSRIFFLCLFILMAGISAGLFFYSIMPASDVPQLATFLESRTRFCGADLLPAMFSNIFCIILIVFSGFSVYGFPFALITLALRSFAMGFCNALLLSTSTIDSFIDIILFLGFQFALAAVYLLITVASTVYAIKQLRNMH